MDRGASGGESMIKEVAKDNSLIDGWPAVESLLAIHGPEALHRIRKDGMAAFKLAGFPSPKHEEWKYTSLRKVEEIEWEYAYGANVFRPDLKSLPLSELEAITLTFVNGQFSPELSTVQTLPDGALVCSFEEAFDTRPDEVLQYLAKRAGNWEGKLGSDLDSRFVDLNNAYLSEGAFVHVPAGVHLELPVHLQFLSLADHGPFAAHPRSLIVLEDGAKAKVIESYSGIVGQYFTNAVTEVFIARHASLEHVKVQQETPEAIHIATVETFQEGESVYHAANVSFGGAIARNDINLWLDGEHSESTLDGIYVGAGEQVVDNHTRIDHAKANCNTFEVYKGILSGKATGVFNGKIFVYEDAQKTDAKQTNKALLLSPTATINTKPQLEIFADDVKCTHGATVGQIREDALFYLRARGIPLEQARALLVYAFAAEVLEKITTPDLVKALEAALFVKLKETEVALEGE